MQTDAISANGLVKRFEHQPVSVVVDATRGLMTGGPTAGSVIAALAWTFGLLAVFAPLAVRRYRQTA